MKPRIAIIVHGRFYAFDLARELLKLGVHVVVFTNYPKRVVGRFGIPPDHVVSFLLHGVATRAFARLGRSVAAAAEPYLHRMFARWAARRAAPADFDLLYCFSGVAEEVFAHPAAAAKLKVLVRASAHVASQRSLLLDEERRTGKQLDKPSPWIVERELREYDAADRIVVVSSFTRSTFMQQGIEEKKLWLIPLGVDTGRFRSPEAVLDDRMARLLTCRKLRVLTTGAFTLRKGAYDYAEIVRLAGDRCEFRWVGNTLPETSEIRSALQGAVSFVPRVPEQALTEHYGWADLFLFPSIEEGLAVVLVQAHAAALPILATENSGAPNIVREGKDGWIIPVRSPESFARRLAWCDENRAALAAMVRESASHQQSRDWSAVAGEFLEHVRTTH